jgi:putative hydrolase of the HAD superfamily
MMFARDVAAIAFDAVGTLIHPEPPAAEAYALVGRRHGSRLDIDEIRRRFHEAFAREEDADRHAGLRTSEDRELVRWRNIVAAVLEDVTDAEACFQELFAHFARPDAWRIDAEVATVLRALSGRGVALGVASNYDQRLRTVVRGTPALVPLAGDLFVCSEVGWRKPAGEFFARLCEHFQLPPGRVLLVGDDRGNDYDGAIAAGLQACLLDPHRRERVPAEHRLSRLMELIA